jgi:hypothetical protein
MAQTLTGYEKPLINYTQKELAQIAEEYKIYYKTPGGEGRISGYNRLTKGKLIELISNDSDYQNSNPRSPGRGPNGKLINRIQAIKDKLIGTEKPEYLMNEILNAIKNTNRGSQPTPGKYYTYIYYAKTPRILYDRHPLIQAVELTQYGFKGFNYHLGEIRQYNTIDGNRLVSGIYEITVAEFNLLVDVPYQKIVLNS